MVVSKDDSCLGRVKMLAVVKYHYECWQVKRRSAHDC